MAYPGVRLSSKIIAPPFITEADVLKHPFNYQLHIGLNASASVVNDGVDDFI